MTPITHDAIRRHADGSIDTDHHLARGRSERSHQAWYIFGAARRSARRVWFELVRRLAAAGATRRTHLQARPNLG